MLVYQLEFVALQDLKIDVMQQAISQLLEALRYNGQIFGREFSMAVNNEGVVVTVVCPEQDSLEKKWDDANVLACRRALQQLGVEWQCSDLMGLEGQSDFTDLCAKPKALILYSTYIQSCSPIRCAEHFMPIPLYKLPVEIRKPLVRWQEEHAALDQLQMNGYVALESECLKQLSEPDSVLIQKGHQIGQVISQQMGMAVYQYLYRVGGESLMAEQQRKCPSCDGEWALAKPLHDMFDFKCDTCLLVSNLSWNWQ